MSLTFVFLCLQLWLLFSSPFTGTIKTINNASIQPSILLLPLIQVRSLTQLVELNEHERKHKGFCNMFKQLKLISSLIQKFCFLKLCKKNEAFCVLIFSCAEDVVDLMKTVTLFPNFNHMIATLTSAMTN